MDARKATGPLYAPALISPEQAAPPLSRSEPRREEAGASAELQASPRRGFLLSPIDWSVIGLVLVAKALTFVFGMFSFEITANERVASLRHAFAIWNFWDAPHYLDLAVRGYQRQGDPQNFIVFYPLFPWMIRLVLPLARDPLYGAFLVSGVASVVAGVALARLVALDYPEQIAHSAVYFMFIFPTAYFLHIGYTESLFLALVISTFLAARRGEWFRAGVLGALAGLTRANGLLLLPSLGVEAIHQMYSERRWRWRWLLIAIVPSGFGVYLLLNFKVFGDPFAFSKIELAHWSQTLVWPWVAIRGMGSGFLWRTPVDAQMIGLQIVLYIAIGLFATLLSLFMLRPSYTVWMATNWLLIAGLSWDLSAPRYVLALFPMFIVFARIARNRECNVAITFWSLASMGVFVAHFVRGWWAF